MTVDSSGVPRGRALPVVAALLVAAVSVMCVETVLAKKRTAPSVDDYLVRIVRATGLEGHVGPQAPVNQYLSLLVQRGVITAQAVQGLRGDQPLTHDFALQVSSLITNPPVPSFLSKTYVGSTFLADHGTALGFVSGDPSDEHANVHDLFHARAHEQAHHCPTPRHHLPPHHQPCPEEP
jgi:hypothetical protein